MFFVEALQHAAPGLPRERYPELGDRYRKHYFALPARDGAVRGHGGPCCRGLKARGHWLTVATGKSRRGVDEALESVELRVVFDGSRTADEIFVGPHPQMPLERMDHFSAWSPSAR